jgi:hypothetical protein
MGTNQVSEEFPQLAMKILDAQRQVSLDVLQFTEDEIVELIELIDSTVRNLWHPLAWR